MISSNLKHDLLSGMLKQFFRHTPIHHQGGLMKTVKKSEPKSNGKIGWQRGEIEFRVHCDVGSGEGSQE
jgi:hypothetical protein